MAKIFPAKMWAVVREGSKTLKGASVFHYKSVAIATRDEFNTPFWGNTVEPQFMVVPVVVSLEEENPDAV